MIPVDSCLERLFEAAARRRPSDLPLEAPFPIEARVLAAWRAATPEESPIYFGRLIRGALVCACAVILISAAVSLRSLNESAPNELVIVDSVIQLSLMQ